MGSHYCDNRTYFKVWFPKVEQPDVLDPPVLSVEIELKIFVEVRHHIFDCFEDGRIITTGRFEDPMTELACRIKLNAFKNYESMRILISHMLTHLQIEQNIFEYLIYEIIRKGCEIERQVTSTKPRLLSLYAKIVRKHTVFEHIERFAVGRAMRESRAELESRNYGMVPASMSSMKALLKRVKVEGEDGERNTNSCTICLDELDLDDESYATQMPCSHVFHDNCIVRWLKESHYCPVCRFEMPTN